MFHIITYVIIASNISRVIEDYNLLIKIKSKLGALENRCLETFNARSPKISSYFIAILIHRKQYDDSRVEMYLQNCHYREEKQQEGWSEDEAVQEESLNHGEWHRGRQQLL